jgi:hypothetical protein
MGSIEVAGDFSCGSDSIFGCWEHHFRFAPDNGLIVPTAADPLPRFDIHLPLHDHRQRESECRALPRLRLDPNPTPMHLNDAF